jgi:biotin carboxylase
MRCALREAGLPGPEFALLHSADDAAAVAARVGLPAVLKPVNGAGSQGIRLVHTVDELAAAYREVSGRLLQTPLGENYAHPVAGPDGPVDPVRSLLVEGALGGREYCVDLIVRDGAIEQLPLVDKYAIDERFFERGFVSPPLDLDADRIQVIQEVVEAAVRAVGLDNTVAHVEILDDPEFGPTIVEINAGRPGGEIVAWLNQSRTGIDLYGELVALTLGAPAPVREPAKLPIDLASIVLYPKGSGRLVAVHGLDECARIPEVIKVVPLYQTGRMMVEDYECPLAILLVVGFADRKQLLEIQAEADALIRAELVGDNGERS